MILHTEFPGAVTPWPKIDQLLSADERFKVKSSDWSGFLFTPKHVSKLSALLYLIDEQGLPFHVQGKGTSNLIPPTHIEILVSPRLLTQIRLLDNHLIEVEAGCNLRILSSSLFALKCEIGLEEEIGKGEKGSVGSAIIRGCQSGLVLREQPIQERLCAIEMVTCKGGILKLGRELEAACAGPRLHSLFWGIKTLKGVITKACFKAYPIPASRLYLTWSFTDRSQLWDSLKILKAFTHSWERLDCVIPSYEKEKGFILGQISGVEEEIEAFKIFCPLFKTALVEEMDGQLTAFLTSRGFSFKAVQLKDYLQEMPYPSYIWYHALIDQCWLATHQSETIIQQEGDFPPWKKAFISCLNN
jgi:FAD/FMN-containing dehydrogenase